MFRTSSYIIIIVFVTSVVELLTLCLINFYHIDSSVYVALLPNI